MNTNILRHNIEFWYNENDEFTPSEMQETDITHIEKWILENDWREWELCTVVILPNGKIKNIMVGGK